MPAYLVIKGANLVNEEIEGADSVWLLGQSRVPVGPIWGSLIRGDHGIYQMTNCCLPMDVLEMNRNI